MIEAHYNTRFFLLSIFFIDEKRAFSLDFSGRRGYSSFIG